MRLLGLILALGAIGWVLYTASGGKDADSAIPQGYQQSMDKASGVEEAIKDSAQQRLKSLDDQG